MLPFPCSWLSSSDVPHGYIYLSWLHQALKKMQAEAADQARKQKEAEACVAVWFFFFGFPCPG